MSNWEAPIVDRNSFDLAYARSYLNQARQGLNDNSEILRTCLNFTDLNRIENNLMHLNFILREVNLPNISNGQFRLNYTMEDLFTLIDLNRVINNIRIIANSFGLDVNEELDTINRSNLHYEDINTLEVIILLIKEFTDTLIPTTQVLDMFKSKAPRKLPVKHTIKQAQLLRKGDL